MITIFDFYAVTLLIVSLVIFFIRFLREEPPVFPYLVIAISCAVGNWLGEAGQPEAGLILLVAASFLFLSAFLYPKLHARFRRNSEDGEPSAMAAGKG